MTLSVILPAACTMDDAVAIAKRLRDLGLTVNDPDSWDTGSADGDLRLQAW